MSNGKVHATASCILAGGFLIGGAILRDPSCFEYAAGALSGVLLSPDLDLDAKNLSYKFFRKYKTETLWSALWHYYRGSIKHGSPLSHLPVLGTLGRLAYMFLFCIILPNLFLSWIGWDFWRETTWWANFAISRWRFTMGLASADAIHWFLDIATRNDRFDINSLLSLKTSYKGKTNAIRKQTR
jgi:uncharacterized metal-binding protein